MPDILLTTKLYAPPSRPRSRVVPRPHLIDRLNEGLWQSSGFARKLTLISAPAGFGKTTLLQQYLNGKTTGQSKPTIGADFSKKEILIDNTVVTLQIWDTAGQEKFQSLGYAFYRGADCCALVYDITNQQSFEALGRWRDGFNENAGP